LKFIPWLLFGAAACAQAGAPWRGVHLWLDNEDSAQKLAATLPALAQAGANAVVIEVNYSFEFTNHPELRTRRFVTQAAAHELAAAARRCGIHLIPEFNCLGHQSFGHGVEPLLAVHPDFNETPSQTPTNHGLYCLSWCPRAPGLNDMVFSLIDEMGAAFEADTFHVGMDEVYLLGADECPRCRGANPARLFADQVQALHDHIVGQRHWRMLMWADRIVGPKYQGLCQYDTPQNDLSATIDLVPKDIVMCDWHYEWKTNYPSLFYLTAHGFPVWPAGFEPLAAARALSDAARRARATNELVIGYLATTWNKTRIEHSPEWPPIKEILGDWKNQK
jgi:hypothetical protein